MGVRGPGLASPPPDLPPPPPPDAAGLLWGLRPRYHPTPVTPVVSVLRFCRPCPSDPGARDAPIPQLTSAPLPDTPGCPVPLLPRGEPRTAATCVPASLTPAVAGPGPGRPGRMGTRWQTRGRQEPPCSFVLLLFSAFLSPCFQNCDKVCTPSTSAFQPTLDAQLRATKHTHTGILPSHHHLQKVPPSQLTLTP